MIYYITGGERSGKSSYAQSLALTLSDTPVYLATARIWDDDFRERVNRHLADRDDRWTNIEEEKYLGSVDVEGKTVVIDCITLWLTNWYMDNDKCPNTCLDLCRKELDRLFDRDATLIIISNEIGMGVHASTHTGRKFTELQGWINQIIATRANKAVLMVSGLPLQLK